MVKHLGRIKVVVRRKSGECGYGACTHNREIVPGDKVFLLTKAGSLPGKPFVIFSKVYHRDCFGPYMLDRFDKLEMQDGGRPSMTLDSVMHNKRKNWLHDRAKLIRQLKLIQDPDQLTRIIRKIDKINTNIENTGYPISGYGRRSQNDILFGRFIHTMKKKWEAPTDIKVRLETQVRWAVKEMTKNGIVDKEAAIEAVLVKWQEEVDERIRLGRARSPTYEEVEQRSLE